jgi:hypothetical protein
MPKKPPQSEPEPSRRDLTDAQIVQVFRKLQLPTEPSPRRGRRRRSDQVVFYRVTGDSQPLPQR